MITSISLYVGVSLLTCRKDFNMDRMLHRGIYSESGKVVEKTPLTLRGMLRKLLGITEEYTRADRILAWSVFLYSFVYMFLLTFIAVVVWNLISPWPNEWWAHYFYVTSVLVAGIIGLVSTVWFSIGGTRDLIQLFDRLKEKRENVLDDIINTEEVLLLRRELAFIKRDFRDILIAYYLEYRSVRDISLSLSISEDAVKQRLHRARKKLKEGMNMTREFGKRSYNPDKMHFLASGSQPSGLPWKVVHRKIPRAFCSSCGYTDIDEHAVKVDPKDRKFVDLIWHFCPNCGKDIGIDLCLF